MRKKKPAGSPKPGESAFVEGTADEPATPADGPGPVLPVESPETGLRPRADEPVGTVMVAMPTQPNESAMSAVTDDSANVLPAAARFRRRRFATRFGVAFTFGVLAVLTASAGAMAAYESSNAGRILPGVHVGTVDLSGLTPSAAAASLRRAFATLGDGQVVLSAAGSERTVTYASLGRRIDTDRIVALAMGIGRDGPTIERIASNIRMFVNGSDIAPITTFEQAALHQEVAALAAQVALAPSNADVVPSGTGFTLNPSSEGRLADITGGLKLATAVLTDPTAPSTVHVALPVTVVEPDVTTGEAAAAREAALRIASDTTLVDGTSTWTITAAQIRSWISFQSSPTGGYQPVVADTGLQAGLAAIAIDVAIKPVDASFLLSSSSTVVGVNAGRNGRALDVPATIAALTELVHERVAGLNVSRVAIGVTTLEPSLTTAEATKTAPLMKPISEWTTKFQVSIANGMGVNIWIPARNIDGQVILPGQLFDFWKAIGPVTRAGGYTDGGVIINGKSEPQGALAGGICSTSTTLFNAALRGGLEMGARLNHYYYIDRYPLGLDATVFESDSGSVSTMSFRNDTKYPILIRGSGWSVGSTGYVKFVLWSVPTGRTVNLSVPIVKNVRPATDATVYTTDLAPGVRKRVEYPANGLDVWVTRTVTDSTGKVIHAETYYSHYARVDGLLQIGISPTVTPAPSPTP